MIFPRVTTALLTVPLVLAVVWYGSLPFLLFVLAISLLCLWEYSLIAEIGGYPNRCLLAMIGGIFVILSLYLDGSSWGPVHKTPGPLLVFFLWCLILFIREFLSKDLGHAYLRIITTIFGVMFFAFFFGHLILIRDLRISGGEGFELVGRPLTFFLIFTIWSVDTGAYIFGRWLGRFRLAPQISPNKTWEGALGGILVASLVGWFIREAALKNALGPLEAALYAALVAVVAQISDLSESLLKRSFGVKDTSKLLPGHGGLMDRFDSFVFAAPFFYYLLLSTGRFQ